MQSESESESCSVMSDSLWPHGLYSPWNSLGQNTGVVSLSFLQGILPTQVSKPGLSHWRWILYQLSHNVSPRILVWVAYPLSMDLPNLGIEPGCPALQADSLPTELSGMPIICKSGLLILPIPLSACHFSHENVVYFLFTWIWNGCVTYCEQLNMVELMLCDVWA